MEEEWRMKEGKRKERLGEERKRGRMRKQVKGIKERRRYGRRKREGGIRK